MFGADSGNHLSLKYKESYFRISGTEYVVETICRNCGTLNQHTRSKRSP